MKFETPHGIIEKTDKKLLLHGEKQRYIIGYNGAMRLVEWTPLQLKRFIIAVKKGKINFEHYHLSHKTSD